VRTVILMPVRQAAEFLRETLKRLEQLDPQPDLYVFTENNSTDETLRLIQGFDRPNRLIRFRFPDDAARTGSLGSTPQDVIGAIRQTLLQVARRLNPDFAIFLDSDVRVMSRDMIVRLTRWSDRADIVGGPVRRNSPWGVFFAVIWPGWRLIGVRPPPTRVREDVMLVGAGCMCLSGRVVQDRRLYFYPVIHPEHAEENREIEAGFRAYMPRASLHNLAEDVAFGLHAHKLGYGTSVDWTILLDHWHDDRRKPWTVTTPNDPPETGVGTWLVGE